MSERLSFEDALAEVSLINNTTTPRIKEMRELGLLEEPEETPLEDTAYYELGSQLLDYIQEAFPKFYENLMAYEKSLARLITSLSPSETLEGAKYTARGLIRVICMRVEESRLSTSTEMISHVAREIQNYTEEDGSCLNYDPVNPTQIAALLEAVLAKKNMKPWEKESLTEAKLTVREAERKQKLFNEKTGGV